MKLFRKATHIKKRRSRRERRLLFEHLGERTLLAVDIVPAADDVAVVDMGFNPQTAEVTLVGTEEEAGEQIAKVFYVNEDRDAISSATLVGLGPDVVVGGISSDSSRIAGVSKSPGSVDNGEGTTWLRLSPETPVGIGYVDGGRNTSNGFAAWSDGIAGDFNNLDGAMIWSPTTGIKPLAGHDLNGARAFDVTADGSIQVGTSTLGGEPGGLAVYWDAEGIHILDDSIGVQGQANAISTDGGFLGGWVAYVIDSFPPVGVVQAAVWDSNRDVTLLEYANGDPFEGVVEDVSNHGYAVGFTADSQGFIWHESFDEPQIFDDWLESQRTSGDPSLPSPSTSVVAIAEDTVNGKLLFAVNGSANFVQVDAPEIVPDLCADSDDDWCDGRWRAVVREIDEDNLPVIDMVLSYPSDVANPDSSHVNLRGNVLEIYYETDTGDRPITQVLLTNGFIRPASESGPLTTSVRGLQFYSSDDRHIDEPQVQQLRLLGITEDGRLHVQTTQVAEDAAVGERFEITTDHYLHPPNAEEAVTDVDVTITNASGKAVDSSGGTGDLHRALSEQFVPLAINSMFVARDFEAFDVLPDWYLAIDPNEDFIGNRSNGDPLDDGRTQKGNMEFVPTHDTARVELQGTTLDLSHDMQNVLVPGYEWFPDMAMYRGPSNWMHAKHAYDNARNHLIQVTAVGGLVDSVDDLTWSVIYDNDDAELVDGDNVQIRLTLGQTITTWPDAATLTLSYTLTSGTRATPWQNPGEPTDVNQDGSVSPIDALVVINRINDTGPMALAAPASPLDISHFLDVNGDTFLSPIDALQVINRINRASLSEGEATARRTTLHSLPRTQDTSDADVIRKLAETPGRLATKEDSATPSDWHTKGVATHTPIRRAERDDPSRTAAEHTDDFWNGLGRDTDPLEDQLQPV
ncbi:MAG: hypothetical protein H8E66_02980 [Planctomycetes bacterium]|nr:hypothetical protein [Planctomycetota bacterium]